jgi:hypothetical protein
MVKAGIWAVVGIGALFILRTDALQGLRVWLEMTSFGTFVRESVSPFGYPLFITLHTLGLSIVVGTSTLVAIRILGFAETIPLQPLGRLFPLIWIGFAVNTVSGSGLAAATADGQFTNDILTAKLSFVILGVICMRLLQKGLFLNPREDPESVSGTERMLAGSLLGFWLLAMVSGRLIAYAGVILGR